MKRLIITLLLVACCSAIAINAQRQLTDSVRIDGTMRAYHMYIPEGTPDGAPLVFVVNGYGNPCKPTASWMNAAADAHKFAVCIPVALRDHTGHHGWNVGYPAQQGWEVDDMDALCKLARTVQKRYHLSRENTFLTGMSNGGDMCYLMAYRGQETFKAFASLAGLTMVWIYNWYDAPAPVPLLEIHGTEDRVSEWDGDLDNKGGWGEYMPVELATGYMVAKNRCRKIDIDTVPSIKGGSPIIQYRYSNPESHNDVWLYKVIGAPHCHFTDYMNTGEEVWKFFSRYIK